VFALNTTFDERLSTSSNVAGPAWLALDASTATFTDVGALPNILIRIQDSAFCCAGASADSTRASIAPKTRRGNRAGHAFFCVISKTNLKIKQQTATAEGILLPSGCAEVHFLIETAKTCNFAATGPYPCYRKNVSNSYSSASTF